MAEDELVETPVSTKKLDGAIWFRRKNSTDLFSSVVFYDGLSAKGSLEALDPKVVKL